MTSRQKQAEATKRLILDTASRLTGELGFDNITIQDICKGAGVSVGTFYHYFSAKEQLILEWYGLADDYFLNTIRPRLDNSKGTVFEKVGIFAEEQVLFGMQYGINNIRQLYRAQTIHTSPDFYSHDRGLVSTLDDIIAAAQQAGEITAGVSASQISNEILRVIRGVILDWLWGGLENPREIASQMAQRYLRTYAI